MSSRHTGASFGFKAKIYLAMGSVCVLLAVVAAIALHIIADNLSTSKGFRESSTMLLEDVVKVSSSMKTTLEAQQVQQDKFLAEQNANFKTSIAQRVALYERILSTHTILNAVGRKANLIINSGESYAIVADEVGNLSKELDLFFGMPELQAVDNKKVKGAQRAAKAYLQIYDEVRQLDEENVSMSQQVELITESLAIGEMLSNRMAVLVDEVKLLVKEQFIQSQLEADEKIAKSSQDSLAVLNDILVKQDDIKKTVSGNLEDTKALESFLMTNRNYLILAAAIALFLGIVFSISIVRLISKPLIRAVEIAEGIAAGNLDQKIDISGADEIGHLGNSLQTMVEKLRDNHVELSSSVKNIDGVTSMVASSIEEISASMEEIYNMTSLNAEKAKEADAMGLEAKGNAENGTVQVEDMVASMREVDKASLEIAKIVKVIDGIAFQTKLLALNAAVEAAHAGEHGQGFAVVAEEVRNLAGRCEEAVRETNALMDGPIKKISHTVAVADKTSESFKVITKNVSGIAALVKEMAKSSDEQAIGIKQTNEGLVQIDNAAQGLSAESDQLYSIMQRFKTAEVDSGPSRADTKSVGLEDEEGQPQLT